MIDEITTDKCVGYLSPYILENLLGPLIIRVVGGDDRLVDFMISFDVVDDKDS